MFLNLTQVMATESQVVTSQCQVMTTQDKLEVSPHVNQNASTMASKLRDFTKMNLPMFLRSNVNEYL